MFFSNWNSFLSWINVLPETEPQFLQDSEYPGLGASLTFLKAFVDKEGPFDGLIGFSQGGIVSSLLAHMMKTGQFPFVKVRLLSNTRKSLAVVCHSLLRI
eukprot:TRINITY_DN1290_c0_g1_i3.p1 TRINITY_DN1290_c0_g1~~TRINITY_DN1290_c0_g1_i3.p1  ORF type:complete len:100 (+),score=10.89 TRINITY_DN1290_c0_g1_i3:135-434(+)